MQIAEQATKTLGVNRNFFLCLFHTFESKFNFYVTLEGKKNETECRSFGKSEFLSGDKVCQHTIVHAG